MASYIVLMRIENFEFFQENNFKIIGFPDKSKMADFLNVGSIFYEVVNKN